MARLLIVSRSMALAMRLADQHEVNEHPVDDLETLGTDLDADVLVLDVGDPMQAVTTVNSLREAGQVTPVLLVSGYQPEWEQVEAQQVEGVVVVPLPITRAALLAGIAELTGSPEPHLDAEAANEVVHDTPGYGDAVDPVEQPETAEEPPAGGTVPIAAPGPAANAVAEADDQSDADTGTDDPDDPEDPDAADDTDVADPDAADPDAADPAADQDDERDEPGWGGGPRGDGADDGPDTPAGPAWGSPVVPDREVPDFNEVFRGPPPPSPPWGETVRVGAPAAHANWSQRPDEPDVALGADPGSGQPGGPQLPPGYEYGPPTGSQSALGPPSRRLPRLGNRPRKMQRRPSVNDTQGMGLVTDPLGPRTDPYGFSSSPTDTGSMHAPGSAPGGTGPGSALDHRLDSEAAALAGDRTVRSRPPSGIVMRPADLVQSLLDQVGDLYGVSDTAQVLADDVIERADADAAAILVPDGPIWRVSGGVGLRPLERRLILESTHWLITEIGAAGRAVLIDDTDIIRPQLAGAPLAAWRHLLAVPVPDVRAIAVLARGQEAGPFTDRDLAAVIAPVREAAALLAQAVQTRRLARALSALRESDSEAQPRRRDA